MEFNKIEVTNYRNFENVKTQLVNRNVIFGLNDSGKTNFLTAIRTVLDYRFRNNINQNDFFELNTQNQIRIKIKLKIDLNDEDSQHIISEMKNARTDKGDSEFVYILLVSAWDDQNMIADTKLLWGNNSDEEELIPVPMVGLTRTQIDNLFDIVYLDSLTDGGKSFNTYRRGLDTYKGSSDENLSSQIAKKFTEINDLVASADVVKHAQEILTEEYKNLRYEDANVIIRSEQTTGGFTNNLVPYISLGAKTLAYPAGGDGRKKILSYAVQNALVKQRQSKMSKITVFLIEEPENSLHKGLQKSLSRRLFNEDNYQYFFMTTHSSEIVSEMDKTMLIRISDQKMLGAVYNVPSNFSELRRGYNAPVAEAMFYDKVLIVEGPSEKLLIDAIGEKLNLFPEENGAFVMVAFGVGLNMFFELLSELGIKVLVRTDNDIKPNDVGYNNYTAMGLKRLASMSKEVSSLVSTKIMLDTECTDLNTLKKEIHDRPMNKILIEHNLFLSKNDLENDMWDVAQTEIENDLKTSAYKVSDFVKWLQKYKALNMMNYTAIMSQETANKIRFGLDGLKEFFENDR